MATRVACTPGTHQLTNPTLTTSPCPHNTLTALA